MSNQPHPHRDSVPPHPHFVLGTLVVLGVVGTLAAIVVGVVSLSVTASRGSVDDRIVSERVDSYLAEMGSALAAPQLPELTPKADLPVVPGGVATAPNMPPATGRTSQAVVEVHFEVVEGVSAIGPDGLEFETWGYRVAGSDDVVSGTPGPVIRARVGDVLRFTITNPESNTHPHNVDFHAVTGPHGGAGATTVAPGETAQFEARLLYPGFFMYHCAYGDVPAHISHGMVGAVLVEPEQPLPDVDHEWYIVQSEFYVTPDGQLDRRAISEENPSHVVFNGAVGALTGDGSLQMEVGERARIHFVNAGLNLISSFHPIGSHWDRVYPEATFGGHVLHGSQTTLVPAGGATVVEIVGQVPSELVLVDHALARAFDKGALGVVKVTGPDNPEIFEEVDASQDSDVSRSGNDSSHDSHSGSGTAQPPADAAQVRILEGSSAFQDMDAADEFAASESPGDYSVNVLRVPVGTTVTWTNDDAMMHTVTAVDGSFDSGFLSEGDSWSYTFDSPGEFEYFCAPHPWMRAKVVVEG